MGNVSEAVKALQLREARCPKCWEQAPQVERIVQGAGDVWYCQTCGHEWPVERSR